MNANNIPAVPNASDNGACVQPASGEVAEAEPKALSHEEIAREGLGLEYVHSVLRWAACGYVHTPDRIASLHTSYRIVDRIINAPASPQAPAPQAVVGEVLPVVAWQFGGAPGENCDLTPHAPAQAIIVAQAAEIERLKREVDEWKQRYSRRTEAYDDAEHRVTCGLAEIADLKAKQAADVDEVMRLAERFADFKHDYRMRACHETVDDYRAAREALRSHLAKDRT